MIRLALLWIVAMGMTRGVYAERPNVVFFLVDDLGWADLACYGSDFHETPHIDALAQSGMKFTQAYAACPVCSPTRASLLTGRHPVRVDITDWIPGSRANAESKPRFQHVDDRNGLALDEVTLAEYLKQQGDYQTFFLGKWHLGGEGYLPTDQGFDVNIGGGHVGSPPGGYYAPWTNPYLKAKADGEYLTERLTDEAIDLIEDADRQRPFFMLMSYYNVHTPIQADKRSVDHYQEIAKERFSTEVEPIHERDAISRSRQDNPQFASMVGAVDLSVGRILQFLEKSNLQENTIIVFFSDNGGLCTLPPRKPKRNGRRTAAEKFVGGPTSNLPLRSGKGWLYEGGVREPMIMRVPGVTRPGSISDQLVVSTDVFPTLVDLVGLPMAPKLHADGVSIQPALKGIAMDPRKLYWHYPHYHGSGWKPGASIRDGDWKLIEFYETGTSELYRISEDIGETNNLADAHPEIRDRLKTQLRDWQVELNAKMPIER
ncbi:Arylsulfatase [Rubripirellula lacrimiformis]|uniref:Arylsulfatase n=1 Tax=Rubripirellula lacrimiformis TaxID=1930273 RepID=A0A517N8E9_9BACT|nr:sulfatase [Rubripirellula lacrimiformis]QDT03414.1 Arylsulfatase [Rubripirellula lacrimiformis]